MCIFSHSKSADKSLSSPGNKQLKKETVARKNGICFDFSKGYCRRGDNCIFQHRGDTATSQSELELKLPGVCKEFSTSCSCKYGDSCKFSHIFMVSYLKVSPASDVKPVPVRVQKNSEKSGVCFAFAKGACDRGGACKFLHNNMERTAVESSDPSAESKSLKKPKAKSATKGPVGMCFAFARGECGRGDSCKFQHVSGSSEVEVGVTEASDVVASASPSQSAQKAKVKTPAVSNPLPDTAWLKHVDAEEPEDEVPLSTTEVRSLLSLADGGPMATMPSSSVRSLVTKIEETMTESGNRTSRTASRAGSIDLLGEGVVPHNSVRLMMETNNTAQKARAVEETQFVEESRASHKARSAEAHIAGEARAAEEARVAEKRAKIVEAVRVAQLAQQEDTAKPTSPPIGEESGSLPKRTRKNRN